MFYVTGKYWARFLCPSTNGNNIIPRLVEIFRNIMRSLIAYIHTHLFHYLDSFRINPPGRISPCREDL